MGRSKVSIETVVNSFFENAPKKKIFGNYRIEENFLLYQAQTSEDAPRWDDNASFTAAKNVIGEKIKTQDGKLVNAEGKMILLEACTKDTPNRGFKIQFYETNTIAVKINGVLGQSGENPIVLVNSETLDLVGRTVAYGRENRNDSLTEIQVLLRGRACPLVPLSNFLDADWKTFKLIDSGKPSSISTKETVGNSWRNRRDVETRAELSGPTLFEVDGNRYFSDLDRRETSQGKIMPFTVEVNKKTSTIEGAREFMKPAEVLAAEKNGLDVKRAGELYFIPCKAPVLEKLTIDEKLLILGEASTYELDKQVIFYLTGENITRHAEKKSKELLEKVPRPLDLPGGKAQTGIIQDGNTLVIGAIDMNNVSGLKLGVWHKLVKAD